MSGCSICGHPASTCGHTDDDRERQARLEAQVIHVPPIVVDATMLALAENSYSAQEISPDGKDQKSRIRRPFYFNNALWVATGVVGQGQRTLSAECYRVIPRDQFKGAIRHRQDYQRCTKDEQDSFWRYAPNGFYHALAVWNGKQEYVLVGPKTEFKLKEK